MKALVLTAACVLLGIIWQTPTYQYYPPQAGYYTEYRWNRYGGSYWDNQGGFGAYRHNRDYGRGWSYRPYYQTSPWGW